MRQARVEALIEALRLEPHPEGGYYRELFRSVSTVQPRDTRPTRAAVTTIYYLLGEGQISRWHRVRSDEVWHLYEGGPLELLVAPPGLPSIERRRLDCVTTGAEPVTVVAADWWQAARTFGSYALMGCTVAPGFEFADFLFLRDDPDAVTLLSRHSADIQRLA